ncbi:MAG: hypothetical protein N3A58_02580 [Spirochaetes bacterium]|nr:hypothetical protein [Spirochaetota bacterium]
MNKIFNKKKLFFNLLFLISILCFFSLLKFYINGAEDAKNLFFNLIKSMEKMLPNKFTSKLITNIFDQDINTMPDSFFINKKNVYFTINYEKGKDIRIDAVNIKDEYKSFFISKLSNEYFFIFLKDSKYIIDSFSEYNIDLINEKDNKCFYIYQEYNDFKYNIYFDKNNIFSELLLKISDKDFLKANFYYKLRDKLLIPEKIDIYLFETKEKIFFKFENLKY